MTHERRHDRRCHDQKRHLPKTKNESKERDPEPERSGDSRPYSLPYKCRQMHQTKKGNQWSFGRKAHLGVEAQSGLVQSVTGTAANVADIAQTRRLAAWPGRRQAMPMPATLGWRNARRSSPVVLASSGTWRPSAAKSKPWPRVRSKELTEQLEKLKAQVRARVEHPFHFLKNLFRHR